MGKGGSCTDAYVRINASDTYGGQEGGGGDEQDADEQDELLRAGLRASIDGDEQDDALQEGLRASLGETNEGGGDGDADEAPLHEASNANVHSLQRSSRKLTPSARQLEFEAYQDEFKAYQHEDAASKNVRTHLCVHDRHG